MTDFAEIQNAIDSLVGTCQSITSAGFDHLEDDPEFTAELDQQIFRCACCDWWCPVNEEASEDVGHDELICSDCAADFDDDAQGLDGVI